MPNGTGLKSLLAGSPRQENLKFKTSLGNFDLCQKVENGLGVCSSVGQCLPSIHMAIGLIPGTK